MHPHQLRHFFAHAYLAAGGQETNLMSLTGWRTRAMVGRYAASTQAECARRRTATSPRETVLGAGGSIEMTINGRPHRVATCPKHGTVDRDLPPPG